MAPKLDGTEKLNPVPFDAHEQVVSKHHKHSLAGGYEPAELTKEQVKAREEAAEK